MADKAIDSIVSLMPGDAVYYVANAPLARALGAEQLREKMEAKGLDCRSYESVAASYAAAKKEASTQDLIFVGGSMSVVAEFLKNYNED